MDKEYLNFSVMGNDSFWVDLFNAKIHKKNKKNIYISYLFKQDKGIFSQIILN